MSLKKLIQNSPYFCTHFTDGWQDKAVHLLGFPFDGTACFRKGACDGPQAIRDVSDGYESYSPYLNADLEDYPLFDFGDLPFGNEWQQNFECFTEILEAKPAQAKLLTLGGEHSIPYPAIKHYLNQYSNLVLIHLDAHADLMDGYEGHHYSHNSIIKRSLDHFGDQHQLIQYGIRSGTKPEFEWMKEHKTLCSSRDQFIQRIEGLPADQPLYLTLDLDFFDPAYLPGTGTPETGGEDFHFFMKFLKILQSKKFVGADVVELAPSLDQTGNSECFTAKLVREVLLTLSMTPF